MSDPRRTAIEHIQLADRRWSKALELTQTAQPDLGFSTRLRELADAAEQEAAALRQADELGLGWTPDPGARNMIISTELRPTAPRRGPAELWERFDQTVKRLGIAMEGVALSAVARAFAELSAVTRALADEVERIDAPQLGHKQAG